MIRSEDDFETAEKANKFTALHIDAQLKCYHGAKDTHIFIDSCTRCTFFNRETFLVAIFNSLSSLQIIVRSCDQDTRLNLHRRAMVNLRQVSQRVCLQKHIERL
jgi:hypothetical protein